MIPTVFTKHRTKAVLAWSGTALAFSLSSCGVLDHDQRENYSYEDPYYLGLNHTLISCDTNRPTPLPDSSMNELSLHERLTSFFNEYRSKKGEMDYQRIKDEGRSELCYLSDEYRVQTRSLSNHSDEGKLAYLINAYHLMIVHLVVDRLDEVVEIDKDDKPENRSPLNIGDKGLRIFEEYKFPVLDGYRSLDDLESKIEALAGFKGNIYLYRAMRGFAPLPDQPLTEENVREKLDENLYELTNVNIFYDDFADPPTAFLPGSLGAYLKNLEGGEPELREILSTNLDLDLWGFALDRDSLLDKEGDSYRWNLEFDPINWQLYESTRNGVNNQ